MNRYIVLFGMMFLLIVGCNQEDNSGGLKDSFKQESNFLKNLKEEDISSVKIVSQGFNKTLVLKGDLYEEFTTEFLYIVKREPDISKERQDDFRILRIKPDYQIIITFSNGKDKEFDVLGRGILRDCDTGGTYQFYIGLEIYQWLK